MNESPYALYRYFDAESILLYIGKSGVLHKRQQGHAARSKWMQFAASSAIERHETPEDLAVAERAAIEAEHPIFNRQYNDTPEAAQRLFDYLERAGRLDILPPIPEPRPRQQGNGPTFASKRAPHGCWDENGHRPWVPGYVGLPEAHDSCPPRACLGRTIPAALKIRLEALQKARPVTDEDVRRLRVETGRAVRRMPPEEARRLITAAAEALRGKG